MNINREEVMNYFTQDIRDRISEMKDEDMKNYLKSLEGTPTWIAILKYTQSRIGVIQDSFLILDPVKEPSKISQYQGIITGMLDLQDAVLSLKFAAKQSEDPKNKENKAKDDLGGGYGIGPT